MKKYVAFEANNAEMDFFDSIEDAQEWLMSIWIEGGVDSSSVPETFIAEVVLAGSKTPFTPENMFVEVGDDMGEIKPGWVWKDRVLKKVEPDENPDADKTKEGETVSDEKRKFWLDTIDLWLDSNTEKINEEHKIITSMEEIIVSMGGKMNCPGNDENNLEQGMVGTKEVDEGEEVWYRPILTSEPMLLATSRATPVSVLYENYEAYCLASDMFPASKRSFSDKLVEMGYKRKRTNKHRCILGLTLK